MDDQLVGYCMECQCSYLGTEGILRHQHEPDPAFVQCEACNAAEGIYLIVLKVGTWSGESHAQPMYVCDGCK